MEYTIDQNAKPDNLKESLDKMISNYEKYLIKCTNVEEKKIILTTLNVLKQ